MRKYAIVAGGLLLSVVLGATVFSAPIAWAAQTVDATIIGQSKPLIVQDPEARHEPWHMFLGPNEEYVVPAGKRLVIEYANGIAQLFGAAQPDWTLDISETTGGQGYHLLGESLFNCTNCYVMSESLRLYAPAGSKVRVGSVPVGSELRLSGYLLDV